MGVVDDLLDGPLGTVIIEADVDVCGGLAESAVGGAVDDVSNERSGVVVGGVDGEAAGSSCETPAVGGVWVERSGSWEPVVPRSTGSSDLVWK